LLLKAFDRLQDAAAPAITQKGGAGFRKNDARVVDGYDAGRQVALHDRSHWHDGNPSVAENPCGLLVDLFVAPVGTIYGDINL
jgi:hypothetical protein